MRSLGHGGLDLTQVSKTSGGIILNTFTGEKKLFRQLSKILNCVFLLLSDPGFRISKASFSYSENSNEVLLRCS